MEPLDKKCECQLDEPYNTLAIIGLISALAAWVIIPVLGAIVGVVCAHMARKQLREQPHENSSIIALLALIVAYVQLVCVAVIVGLMVYFGLAVLQGTL